MDLENLPTTELTRTEAPSWLAFVLVVVDGPDRGKRFVLDPAQGSRFLVGHSPACAIQLSDRTVSRRHAALDLEGPDLNLTDLGSTNGTEVEAPRVHAGKVRLDGGEIVRLGGTTLRIERDVGPGPSSVDGRTRFGRLVGESAAMRALYPLCERLPPTLVESELFGHEKGAFTGATAARKGVFEQAHGGTLLIDEIGDLDLPLQAKLLRALERSEVRRVGANRWNKVDVRVIAAIRRDLDRAVQEGTFRDDLFHRLAVGRIELPPVRRRTGDIEVLAAHFAQQLGKTTLPPHVVSAWRSLSWPGNAREIRNAVARYLALGDLATHGASTPSAPEPDEPASSRPPKDVDLVEEILKRDWPIVRAREHLVREFEQRYVARVLEQHGGVVTRAAEASGIARRHFQRLRARSPLPKE